MTARDRKQVERWIRKWQRRLLLQAWRIGPTVFAESSHPDTSDDYVYYAAAEADATYTAITFVVYPEFWALTERERERWILHEMIHGPCSPLAEIASRSVRRKQAIRKEVENAEERLVEWVATFAWKAFGEE